MAPIRPSTSTPPSVPQTSPRPPHPRPNSPTTAAPPSPPPSKKRKKKDAPHILHQSTIRGPLYSYIHLHLTTSSPPSASSSRTTTTPTDLDALTIRSLLTPPLQSYLGLTGAAIPIDILAAAARDVHIRMPRQDAKAFQAALSSWVGSCDAEAVPQCAGQGRVRVSWRVVAVGGSLVQVQGDGMDLFGG